MSERLLSNEELRDTLINIVTRNGNSGRIPELLDDEINKLHSLINSQKQAWADFVIGEDLPVMYKAGNNKLTKSWSIHYGNTVRAEQRERNKS